MPGKIPFYEGLEDHYFKRKNKEVTSNNRFFFQSFSFGTAPFFFEIFKCL
jgi:hypothetical protein